MFFKLLYKKWRAMFYVVLIFLMGQTFFMYKGVETVPWFLYSMYSTPRNDKDTTYRTRIFVKNVEFEKNSLGGRESETLLGSLSYYNKIRKENFFATDSTTIASRFKSRMPSSIYKLVHQRLANNFITDRQFTNWWLSYFSKVNGAAVDSVTIIRSTTVWKPNHQFFNDTVSSQVFIRSQQ